MLRILLPYICPDDVHSMSDSVTLPLCAAIARCATVEFIRELIALGADVNRCGAQGECALTLSLARTCFRAETVRFLLTEARADPAAITKHCDRSIVHVIASSLFSPFFPTRDGYQRANSLACQPDDEQLISLLELIVVERKLIDINQRAVDGATVLHDAAEHSSCTMMSSLLRLGAVVQSDAKQQTPLHVVACTRDDVIGAQLIELLLPHSSIEIINMR